MSDKLQFVVALTLLKSKRQTEVCRTSTQKFPWHASWLQSQSSSIVSPVPSHDALQYLPSGGCGHVHGGFLHLLSSAMISSLALVKNGLNYGTQSLTQPGATWVRRMVFFCPMSGARFCVNRQVSPRRGEISIEQCAPPPGSVRRSGVILDWK